MALKKIPALIAVAIGLLIWFVIPVPDGVDIRAWHLLAIFIATIAGIIGKALPLGAVAIIGMMMVAVTGVTSDTVAGATKDALSSLSSPLIWLIGLSVMVARGLIKTGLGARIGYYFISLFGKKTLGIAYSLSISELVLAPITPSNTARGGGIIHPIMRSISESFHSTPEEGTRKKIGRYLALVNYNTNPITSAMFITATAPNPLVVKSVADLTGSTIHLSWGTWALAMLLPGLVCLLLMPLIVWLMAPPEIKSTPDAADFARERLHQLGRIKRDEWIMLGVFALMLLLWADVPAALLGSAFKVHSTATALLGLCLLLITGVLTWDDILKEKSAWDTIVWFAALVMMAGFLNKLGLISWVAQQIQGNIASMGMSWQVAVVILTLIYLYAHYFFASTTAHISAMFAAFYGAGLALGAPPMLYALMLAAASSLMMSLTHYATGTAPVIFNSGYATLGEWWRTGFVVSIINIIVWVAVGLFWWKVLGLY